MSRVPFDSPISLLTTLLILLVVCSASVENRATSPAHSPSHKKPPFNGSMFGKRSDLPPLIRASYASKAQDLIGGSNLETGDEGFIGPSAVETLALEMVRQEPLIKASVDQCLQLQRSLDSDPNQMINMLCAELINNREQLGKNVWFKQLLFQSKR